MASLGSISARPITPYVGMACTYRRSHDCVGKVRAVRRMCRARSGQLIERSVLECSRCGGAYGLDR